MGVTQLHTSAYLSYFSVTHQKCFLDHSTITFLSACKTGVIPLHEKKSKRQVPQDSEVISSAVIEWCTLAGQAFFLDRAAHVFTWGATVCNL